MPGRESFSTEINFIGIRGETKGGGQPLIGLTSAWQNKGREL